MKTPRIIVLASILAALTSASAMGATLSSAFTFQGRLVAGGNPANGPFDLRLMLFNAASGGSQVGTTQTNLNVSVSNGLFTTLVDFGASAFDGTTYWVDIAVRPGNTANPFRMLTPRQRLAGAPYALFAANAARADLATTATTAASAPWSGLTGVPPGFSDGVDNDTLYSAGAGLLLLTGPQFSVNFAGTGSATTVARSDHTHTGAAIVSGIVADAVIDAAIARDNEVLGLVKAGDGPGSQLDADTLDGLEADEFWKVGGNSGTLARDYLGTSDNTALELRVNGARALRLEPSATSPNVLGGYRGNFVAAGVAGATIAGGGTTNDGSGVVRTNRIGANYGAIGGGYGHSIDATHGTIGGGRMNSMKSTATNATIPGGMGAMALNVGQMAYASGSFVAAGDAQTSTYVLRGSTLAGVTTNLTLDGVSAAMVVPVGGHWAFDALVVGSTTGAATAAFQVRGAVRNLGGTAALVPAAPAVQLLGADGGGTSWTAVAAVDSSLDALTIRVTSTVSAVRWVATVRVVELVF